MGGFHDDEMPLAIDAGHRHCGRSSTATSRGNAATLLMRDGALHRDPATLGREQPWTALTNVSSDE